MSHLFPRNKSLFVATILMVCGILTSSTVAAAGLPANVQAEVDAALAKLDGWSADAEVVAAVKAANAAPDDGMSNGKWVGLDPNSPEVTAITSNALSKKLAQWRDSEGLNKLYVRAQDGHLVGGAQKPMVYNIAKRKAFKNVIGGTPWHAPKIKPDPTTQKPVVQISTPIKDGDRVIGVMHSSVIVQ
jgi:hypothetical protein